MSERAKTPVVERAHCSGAPGFPSSLLIAFFTAFTCFAQPAIEPYLATIKGVDFQKVGELAEPQAQRLGPFSANVLQEYGLLSYSHWKVRPEAEPDAVPSQVADMEVYQLQNSPHAFGFFTLWNAPGERLDLPVENYYQHRELLFWRGSFVFHISESPREWLQDLSRRLIRAVPQINIYPLTVVHLPQENLIRKSIRFHIGKSSFAQSRHFPRSLASKLGFEDQIEVATAQYAPEGHSLFLVGYPTTALAADHFVKLQNALQDHLSPQGIYMKKVGVLVSLFFGPEAEARQVLGGVEYSPGVKWIYEKQPGPEDLEKKRGEVMNFLGLVRGTFIATFVLIVLTLLVGIVAGLVRYQVLKRYPGIDKLETMVQLKLFDRSG